MTIKVLFSTIIFCLAILFITCDPSAPPEEDDGDKYNIFLNDLIELTVGENTISKGKGYYVELTDDTTVSGTWHYTIHNDTRTTTNTTTDKVPYGITVGTPTETTTDEISNLKEETVIAINPPEVQAALPSSTNTTTNNSTTTKIVTKITPTKNTETKTVTTITNDIATIVTTKTYSYTNTTSITTTVTESYITLQKTKVFKINTDNEESEIRNKTIWTFEGFVDGTTDITFKHYNTKEADATGDGIRVYNITVK